MPPTQQQTQRRRRGTLAIIGAAAATAAAGYIAWQWWQRTSNDSDSTAGVSLWSRLRGDPAAVRRQREREVQRIRLRRYYDTLEHSAERTALERAARVAAAVRAESVVPGMQELRAALSAAGGDKVAIWRDAFLGSTVHLFAQIYAMAATVSLACAQTSVLGRNVFLDSLASERGEHGALLAESAKRLYLEKGEYLAEHGLPRLMTIVADAAEPLLADIPLERRLTFSDLSALLGRILAAVDVRMDQFFLDSLLPPEEDEDVGDIMGENGSENHQVLLLLNETRDVVEDASFRDVVLSCAALAFDDALAEFRLHYSAKAEQQNISTSGVSFSNASVSSAETLGLTLAHCVPAMQRVVNVVSRPNTDTDVATVVRLLHSRRVREFGFDVFQFQMLTE